MWIAALLNKNTKTEHTKTVFCSPRLAEKKPQIVKEQKPYKKTAKNWFLNCKQKFYRVNNSIYFNNLREIWA